jgi:YD repeat-containing protein
MSASGAEQGRQIIFTERLWFSSHVKVTVGEGHITGFRRDGMSRKKRTLWNEGSAVQRTEQATCEGLVQLTRIDPKKQVTTYQCDALNRLKDILYAGNSDDNRHYTHDLVGNLKTVTDSAHPLRKFTQQFDHLNRLTSETSSAATHIHTYDKADNRRTTSHDVHGDTLVSTCDKLSRLLTLTENGMEITRYGYDLNGNVTRMQLPNGTEARCTFDALNRKFGEASVRPNTTMIHRYDYSQPHNGYCILLPPCRVLDLTDFRLRPPQTTVRRLHIPPIPTSNITT